MTSAAQRKARSWERRVLVSAHPIFWPISQLAGRLGPDVCMVPGLGYIVSGAESLRAILGDVRRFRKDGPAGAAAAITQVLGPTALANMDGPAHTELRRLLGPMLSRDKAAWVLTVVAEQLLSSLKTRLAAGEAVDLAHASRILVTSAIHAMTSSRPAHQLRQVDALQLHGTATRLAGLLSVRLRPLTGTELDRARALRDTLLRGVDTPANSDDAATLPGRLRASGLDPAEVRGVVAMLFLGGVETTSAALPRIVALLTDIGHWPQLTDRRASVERTVDEALRCISPLPGFTRTVAENCEVRGHRFRAGRSVIGHIYNAVRDRRVIDRGDEFDADRATPVLLRQLWFGAGVHFCIGMPVARELALETVRMLASLGGVQILQRRPERRVLIPAYRELLVAVSGRARKR